MDDERAQLLRRELLAHLTHRASDPILVEDLTQETLAKVLAGLPKFRGQSELRTWARRIADNVWRDHLRHRRASPVQSAKQGDENFSVVSVLDSLDPSSSEIRYDQQATRECLLRAVKQLPVGERSVVLLHEFGDLPLQDVATILDCSLDAAKQRLRRGRRRLARICQAECTRDTADDGTALCSPKASVNAGSVEEDAPADESEPGR
jgi:RNA polymerase sigma-70 factor (ECF subfamily)